MFQPSRSSTQLRRERERAECEDSLPVFIAKAWPYVEPATEYIHGWHVDAISEHLEAVSRGEIRKLLINIPPRHMKLCADSTPVPTPDGMRRHGDLRVGDRVYGPDGQPSRITHISKDDIADVEITFSTGETITVNEGHLWIVKDRCSHRVRAVDSAYLLRATLKLNDQGKARNRFAIPSCAALQNEEKELPLDPYFLGCWLGDGVSTKPGIAHDKRDTEHIEKIRRRGLHPTKTYANGPNGVFTYFTRQGVIETLRAGNLYDNKHIPELYFCGSVQQRRELLAGIVDTDGSLEKFSGRFRISTVDAFFAKQIQRLAYSVGYESYIVEAPVLDYGKYKSSHAICYQVGFQAGPELPTAIPRKQSTRTGYKSRARYITGVRRVAALELGHCITIDNANGLYVVGNTHLVTHNSLQVGVFWPAWSWTTHPNTRWLFGSYSQALTIRDALKTRRLLDSAWYRERWGQVFSLTGDQNAKSRYDNDKGGYRIAAACGGGTGEGGDVLVIDDPHNISEAESAVVREGVIEWYDQVWVTRRNNPKTSAMVVVMQRVHEKDLAGHILEQGGWEHLCLPAEYDGRRSVTVRGDAETRQDDGALLWPERFGVAELSDLKKSLGLYGAAGQLQQRPYPKGGGLFKRSDFEIVERPAAPIVSTCRSWDFAASLAGKRTAGVKWLRDTAGVFYIAHVVKGQWRSADRDARIKQQATEDGTDVPVIMEQEPGSGGLAQVESLTRLLAGYSVHVVKPSKTMGDKETRATPMASQSGIGNIKIVRGEWNTAFLDEAESFPNGEYLDQVDAAAQGFNWIAAHTLVPTVPSAPAIIPGMRIFAGGRGMRI